MVGLSRVRLKIGEVASWVGVSVDKIKAAERKGIIFTRQSRGKRRRYTFKQAERLNHYFLFKDRMHVLRQAGAKTKKALVRRYNAELKERYGSWSKEWWKNDDNSASLEQKTNELRKANSSLRSRLSRERNQRQKRLLIHKGLPDVAKARKLGKMIVGASRILSALPLVARKRSVRKHLGQLAKEAENLREAAAECGNAFRKLLKKVKGKVRSKR